MKYLIPLIVILIPVLIKSQELCSSGISGVKFLVTIHTHNHSNTRVLNGSKENPEWYQITNYNESESSIKEIEVTCISGQGPAKLGFRGLLVRILCECEFLYWDSNLYPSSNAKYWVLPFNLERTFVKRHF